MSEDESETEILDCWCFDIKFKLDEESCQIAETDFSFETGFGSKNIVVYVHLVHIWKEFDKHTLLFQFHFIETKVYVFQIHVNNFTKKCP